MKAIYVPAKVPGSTALFAALSGLGSGNNAGDKGYRKHRILVSLSLADLDLDKVIFSTFNVI